jgi:hypothetical protein
MNADEAARSRKLVYTLLITVAAATTAGRILSAERLYEPSVFQDEKHHDEGQPVWPRDHPEPTAMFSSNDRSRWATIRALAEGGTYMVGRRSRKTVLASAAAPFGSTGPLPTAVLAVAGRQARIDSDSGIFRQESYQGVDYVMDPRTLEFYSSKPPLLSTLLAGEYWILYQCGWSITQHPAFVVRVIMGTIHWLPVVIYLFLLSRILERFGTTDWGRYYILAAAGFGTMVTLFTISINNHVIATCTALFALYPVLMKWRPGQAKEDESAGASRPASALSRRGLLLSGFFAGCTVAAELPALAFAAGLFIVVLWRAPRKALLFFAPAAALPVAALLLTNYLALGQLRPVQSQFNSPWYHYEGSHWLRVTGEDKRGIDWARLRESRAAYAFHVFFGHHGLFSLSPIYWLTAAGLIIGLIHWRRKAMPVPDHEAGRAGNPPSRLPGFVFPLTLFLSMVVIGFYLIKTDNYGGWSNGLRWLMWLTPFWLLSMLPAVDRLAGRRWGRGLALLLLGVSIVSVTYRSWNPWRLPWLYNLMVDLGWPGY